MSAIALPASLDFQGTEIRIVDRDNRPWVTAADLARALGYTRTDKASQLYRARADEFTPDMTAVITVNPETGFTGVPTETRIFSPRGCHLVAMFARTARAKAFRRWVLDVLDALALPAPESQPSLPEPTAGFTPGQMEALKAIADLCPLTPGRRQPNIGGGADNSSETANRDTVSGYFHDSLWRESGNRKDRACSQTSVSSRRQGCSDNLPSGVLKRFLRGMS
ncbi:MAG: putative phage antirepressor BRO family [Rhodospirillaceae bacterium]|nr:MAG: putative phage antirepressor BRO family [Rhodospirillaceae bacterium]